MSKLLLLETVCHHAFTRALNEKESLKLEAPAMALALDKIGNEGLVGLMTGGIYYFNWKENCLKRLVGAPSSDLTILKARLLSEVYLATIHIDGSVKIWDISSCEELASYSFRDLSCSEVLFDSKIGFFYLIYSNNTIRKISVDNFEEFVLYNVDDIRFDKERGVQFIREAIRFEEQSQGQYYLLLTNHGDLYYSDLNDKDGSIEMVELVRQKTKLLAIGIRKCPEFGTIALILNNGSAQIYEIYRGSKIYPELKLLDNWEIYDGRFEKNRKSDAIQFANYNQKREVQRDVQITLALSGVSSGIAYGGMVREKSVIIYNFLSKKVLKKVEIPKAFLTLRWDEYYKSVQFILDDGEMTLCNEEGELYEGFRAPFIGPQSAMFYLKTVDSYLVIAKKAFTLPPSSDQSRQLESRTICNSNNGKI